MEIKLPSDCLRCPNKEALKLAIINFELEFTKDNLLHLLESVESACSGKCAEEAISSSDSAQNHHPSDESTDQ